MQYLPYSVRLISQHNALLSPPMLLKIANFLCSFLWLSSIQLHIFINWASQWFSCQESACSAGDKGDACLILGGEDPQTKNNAVMNSGPLRFHIYFRMFLFYFLWKMSLGF